jgi:phenylalanyl-tRNA synthetase alpha chain
MIQLPLKSTVRVFMNIIDQIQNIKVEFETAMSQIKTSERLEETRLTFLGRKGRIAQLMDYFKTLPEQDRRAHGKEVQLLRTFLETAIEDKKKEVAVVDFGVDTPSFDVTLSKYDPLQGKKHIYSQVIEELEDIFISMGYDLVSGNEVESDYYNFTALNIPEQHPARDTTDTFWLTQPGLLLRTHTSSIQAHIMRERKPPIAVFSIGRCYRNEKTDATHDFMFMQMECMFIDKDVSIANLLATAQIFLRTIFQKSDLSIRVRPGYFPFVEPGLEIDATCPFCKHGCTICKKSGWIEMLGSGLIHPNVLAMSGIDSKEYSGFALGMGIERLIMLRHGITDIRLFHSSKLAFLDQF